MIRVQKSLDLCELCGKPLNGQRHLHHIFEGTANRKKSDEDGMTCYLHPCCHLWLHDHPRSMLNLKQRAQTIWEKELGTREQFIKRYGRSYL